MTPISGEELDRLLEGLFEDEPPPWWRSYADAEVPAEPDEVPDEKRLCFAEEDKARSPYYPEVEPPPLPEEAAEAGITRDDLLPGDGG